MLQKMRHAGLAVAFVPRADEVSDVDRVVSIERSGIRRTFRPFASRYSVTPSTEVTRVNPWAERGRPPGLARE